MKILLYFSSHRQLKEIEYSSLFFNRTSYLKKCSDVMIHCDNDSLTDEQIYPFIKYETNTKLVRSKQTFPIFPNGVHNGFLKGLSNNFDSFKYYDFVIHMVPDCYITYEDKIVNLLLENIDNDYNFIVDYHPDNNSHSSSEYICDFFIFKPSKIHNIFIEHSDENVITAEKWLYSKLHERNIKHKKIYRGVNHTLWNIDDFGLIHNHNLERIQSILDGNEDINLRHN